MSCAVTSRDTAYAVAGSQVYATFTGAVTSVARLEEQLNPDPLACFRPSSLAIIYNALGEQVAILPVTNDAMAAFDLESLPMQPLWAVSGECVRRVR